MRGFAPKEGCRFAWGAAGLEWVARSPTEDPNPTAGTNPLRPFISVSIAIPHAASLPPLPLSQPPRARA